MPPIRAATLALVLLLAGCGDSGPTYKPLTYAYLTPIRLNVAHIVIDPHWAPRDDAKHVEDLSPETPLAAVVQMAQDRLSPGGSSGQAEFVVDDASIVEGPNGYQGHLAVQINVLGDDGTQHGEAKAQVIAIHPVTDDEDDDAVRADLYALTSKLMDEMNVELQYQVQHSLQGLLQTTSPAAPAPAAVQTEPLGVPPKQ